MVLTVLAWSGAGLFIVGTELLLFAWHPGWSFALSLAGAALWYGIRIAQGKPFGGYVDDRLDPEARLFPPEDPPNHR
jgi:hypothetical protein